MVEQRGMKRNSRKGSYYYNGLFTFWAFDDRALRRHLSAAQHTLCSLWTYPQHCPEAFLSHKSETQHALKVWEQMWWQQRESSPTWTEVKKHLSSLLCLQSNFFLVMFLLWAAIKWTPYCNFRDFFPHFVCPPFLLVSIFLPPFLYIVNYPSYTKFFPLHLLPSLLPNLCLSPPFTSAFSSTFLSCICLSWLLSSS